MNITTRLTGLLLGLACTIGFFSGAVAQPYGSISFETFYHELSPYGNWVHNPQYGQVWIPNVDRGFRPYQTRGHWVMTEYGNTWVSDYAWGWAPFHYGRWHLDDYYGWMWVPGTEWGPAWVAWRSGGGYYGWAPLGPGLNVNVSINIGRRIPRPYWTFVRQRYITSPRIYDYCVPRRRVVNVINHTTVINHTYVVNNQHHYYSGPQRRDIERVTHRSVPVRRVQSSRRPGTTAVRGGSVAMYRPTVRGRQGNATGTGRSGQNGARGNSPTRSSFDRTAPRFKRPTTPAVRSSESRAGSIRRGRSSTGSTRSLYDNRSEASAGRSPSRTPARERATSGTNRRSYDQSVPPRTNTSRTNAEARPRRSYGERSTSDRSYDRGASNRSSSQRSTSSQSRTRSSSRSSSSGSSRSSSSSSVSSPRPTRSSGSQSSSSVSRSSRAGSSSGSYSRSGASSSSSSRSSAPASRSRSGSSRSGSSRGHPQ